MTLFVDLLMIVLLICVVVRTFQLSNRLNALNSMDGEVAPMLRNLSQTLAATSQQIEGLKQSAKGVHQSLSNQLEKSRQLKDDLDFMINHGSNLATTLESLIKHSRSVKKTIEPVVKSSEEPIVSASEVVSLFSESDDQAFSNKSSVQETRPLFAQRIPQ